MEQNPTKVDIQRITFEMRSLQHRPELPEMWRNVEIIPDKEEKPPQLRGRITESRCGSEAGNYCIYLQWRPDQHPDGWTPQKCGVRGDQSLTAADTRQKSIIALLLRFE